MGKKSADSEKKKGPKFSEWFPDWWHHVPTGDEEETWCGTRTGKRWRQLLFFYLIYYSALIIFWIINFSAMVNEIPDRIGGKGPLTNRIIKFGYTQVAGAETSYSAIAADSGAYSGSGALDNIRRQLSQSEYNALQSQISTDVTSITSATSTISGSQFLYENCTVASGAGCTAASNYGTFGPVVIAYYRNRQWNRPEQGSTCALTCTYVAEFADGSAQATGTISANHFWMYNYRTGAWVNGQANFECEPFQNQRNYKVATAVSMEGMQGNTVSQYTLTCTSTNLDEDPSGSIRATFTA